MSESAEALIATAMMLALMAGFARLVFGRMPWAWARLRKEAVRIYRISPDPSAPPPSMDAEGRLREFYAVDQDGVRIGSLATVYFNVYSGDMRSELRLGDHFYTFVEQPAEDGVISRQTGAGRPEPIGAITRPRRVRFSASVRLDRSTYVFNTGMYFREYAWTDAAKVRMLAAKASLIPPKGSEVLSKGLASARDEAVLAALGFHLFVYENYTYRAD